MSQDQDLDAIYNKLKSSPYWRADFKIEEVKNGGGIKVYYVKADDQESETILAIARLNEELQS